MHPIHRILVVVDRARSPVEDVVKAVALARRHRAQVELFLCEAEQAYVLDHRYDREGVERVRAECAARGLGYLRELRASVDTGAVEVSLDAVCESPLFESIVRKVLRSGPDLVLKRAAGENGLGLGYPDPNDWQLMRSCPCTLMMTRGAIWHAQPRFLAAVDVSAAESAGLAARVVESGRVLSQAWHATLEVIYGETAAESAGPHCEQLRALCGEHGVAPESIHVVHGQPELALPAFLEHQAYDVMVLGALSHRPGEPALVGTLTSKLLNAVDCDFVLVKPPAHGSAAGRRRRAAAAQAR